MPKRRKPKRQPPPPSRGALALIGWRGDRDQSEVHALLGLDAVSYNRFERGWRKPTLVIALEIERVTGGAVSAHSWIETEAVRARKAG